MTTEHGGCHCGAVRYSVEIDLNQPALECNCSHCQIQGLLLMFVPRESFTLQQGEDSLTKYLFNKEKIEHHFCKVCGVEAFAYGEHNGAKMAAINIRSIDGIELEKLERKPVDGRSW